MRLLLDLITLVRALASDRARLALENVMLRQQLNVLQRNAKRPRIRSELALLGHDVAESTGVKYMVKHRHREPTQSWRTFLGNHSTSARRATSSPCRRSPSISCSSSSC